MVITCIRRTMGKELLGSRRLLLGEESIGQDYEQDMLIGLDHEWVSFVGA